MNRRRLVSPELVGRAAWIGAALLCVTWATGCGDDGGTDARPDTGTADVGEADTTSDTTDDSGGAGPDATTDTTIDVPGDAEEPDDATSDTDEADSADSTDAADGADGTEPPPYPSPTFRGIGETPAESILPSALSSCAVLHETRCSDGTIETCVIYDAEASAPAEDVPRMTEQAYTFDRYYDLYHEYVGQTVDIDFSRQVPPGTPEDEWEDAFRRMDAYGDASGWTGTALWAAAARYMATGTEADYERMLTRAEWMMFLYEVTDIPGMIARSHFGLLPDGAPDPAEHPGKALSPWFAADGSSWHYHYPIDESHLDRLPAYYTDGVEIGGAEYGTEARWQGDASRDMYVRSMPGVLLAHELLGEGAREDRLRELIAAELPCTLNRMRKGRIDNLQSNPDLVEAVTALLGSGTLTLDEDDIDFRELDTIIFYAMEQPNPAHMDLFDPSCPDGPPLEADPSLTFDASAPTFLLEIFDTFNRTQRSSPRPIAWMMVPSVRAGDMMYMMQWALVAGSLTDDPSYGEFVERLMVETEFEGVLRTYGAFSLPKWCQPHFAPSLSYPTLYNLLARIDASSSSELWSLLSEVAFEEARMGMMAGRGDAFFGVLYNRMWSDDTDPDGGAYVGGMVELLSTYGMNADDHLEPDRNYARNLVEDTPPGIELEEPSEEIRRICETPIEVLGIEIPAEGMSDENPRAVDALPLSLRIGGGFNWTQDPWRVLKELGPFEFTTQYPMLGMTAPYWIGRADGVIDEGGDLALAWHGTGESCDD